MWLTYGLQVAFPYVESAGVEQTHHQSFLCAVMVQVDLR